MKDLAPGTEVELIYSTSFFGIGEIVNRFEHSNGVYYDVFFKDYKWTVSCLQDGRKTVGKQILVLSTNLKLVSPLVCLARSAQEDGNG